MIQAIESNEEFADQKEGNGDIHMVFAPSVKFV